MASPKRTAQDEQIEDRRRLVASLRLKGMTVREVQLGLAELRKVNPETGQPWGIATIHADCEALKEQWRKEATAEIAEHQSRLNAELEEVKRFSWRKEDTERVLKAIEQQRKLLGADAPTRTLIGGVPGADPISIQSGSVLDGIDIAKLSQEELDALEAALATLDRFRAGEGGTGQP